MRLTPARGRESGMTILELMVAMSLFVLLGVALVKLVHRSFDFLSMGGGQGEVSDVVSSFESVFSEDLRSVFVLSRTPGVAPDVRMLHRTVAWPVEYEAGGKTRTVTVDVPVFAFVRVLKGEEKDRLTRKAGNTPGGTAYYDGYEDEIEAMSGQLRPLGGLVEVLYAAVPDPDSGGSTTTLYRAFRAPIGGEGSLLDPETFKAPANASAEATEAAIEKIRGMALLRGVLHFSVRFWGGATTTWDLLRSTGGAYPTWDSTLGVLPGGRDRNEFALAVGPESLSNPRDDLFPRRVRAEISVIPSVGGARFARLSQHIADKDESPRFDIDPSNIVPAVVDTEKRYLKVGPEWIKYVNRIGDTFSVAARGERGAADVPGDRGEIVYCGRAGGGQVTIPAFVREIE